MRNQVRTTYPCCSSVTSSPSMTSTKTTFPPPSLRSTSTTSLQVSVASTILLLLGWKTAVATGASNRIVCKRWEEGPAFADFVLSEVNGVCGKSAGLRSIERSHMMQVESRDAERMYRLFLDQLQTRRQLCLGIPRPQQRDSKRLGYSPNTSYRSDVTSQFPGQTSTLHVPNLYGSIKASSSDIVPCVWS